MRPNIVRVWGAADDFDIEFHHLGGKSWTCSVPPDTQDGVYAVTIYAINSIGKEAYWIGELFMCDGICHITLEQPNYLLQLNCNAADIIINENIFSKMIFAKGCQRGKIYINENTSDIIFSKGCPHEQR